jgi:hypothetical protein
VYKLFIRIYPADAVINFHQGYIMKLKHVLTISIFIITLGITTGSWASTTFYSQSSYFQYNFIHSLPGSPGPVPGTGLCIGGSICGVNDYLKIIYPSSYVSRVVIAAHDNVGDKYKAVLGMYVNGVLQGTQDVKKDGSSHTFYVNTYVSSLEFRSFHESGASNGDETIIMNVTTY